MARDRERPVNEMMVLHSYRIAGREILVFDGTKGYMPGAAAIRLLAGRKGVGADRIIVYTGTKEIPSFRVFAADGGEQTMTAEDYRVLSRSWADFELHVTDFFVGLMREADARFAAAAC